VVLPAHLPPLDRSFRPAVLVNRAFRDEVQASGAGVPLVFGLERPDGSISRFETRIFAENHPQSEESLRYAERLFKFLLWQRGGCRIYVGGPRAVGEAIRHSYAPGGAREFEFRFMG